MRNLLVVAITLTLFSAVNAYADTQKTFTIIDECYVSEDTGCAILDGAGDIEFKVEYSTRIAVTSGGTMTVLVDENGNWKKITNKNGPSAQIISNQEW